jgi:hypothetical protein
VVEHCFPDVLSPFTLAGWERGFLTLHPGDKYDLGARHIMHRAVDDSPVTPKFISTLFAKYDSPGAGGATVLVALLVLVAVTFVVFKAGIKLWQAGVSVLRAVASLLVAFVMTLPEILVAGAIALGGLWAVNNLSFSQWPTFTSILPGSDSKKETSPRTGQPGQTTGETVGRGDSRTGDDRERQ